MPDATLQEVEAFQTLEAVMKWAFARTPPAALVNVVTQDEFTHDVVIKAEGIYLVFDTT